MMRPSERWIRGARPDAALALSWVPFAFAAHWVEGNSDALGLMIASVMFISFAHQPLTFPLVYGSPWRLATHRRLFVLFPPIAVVVIAVATHLSMTLVALVGALWNVEHILMQRYGITRIYGRKAGDDQGRWERWMLVTWFLVPLLWTTASGGLHGVLDRLSIGSVDSTAAGLLAKMTTAATVALIGVGAAAIYLTWRWAAQERRIADRRNYGKWLYLASSAGLFALALVDPIAAVVGFVGSHSVEYFVIVNRSIGSETRHSGPLARVARLPHGRAVFFVAYGVSITAIFLVLYRMMPASVLLVSVLTIGAVHFFYDAFIWKLRKPNVATAFSVTPVGSATGLEPQPA
jgi:hypothetical protein